MGIAEVIGIVFTILLISFFVCRCIIVPIYLSKKCKIGDRWEKIEYNDNPFKNGYNRETYIITNIKSNYIKFDYYNTLFNGDDKIVNSINGSESCKKWIFFAAYVGCKGKKVGNDEK